MAAYFYRTVGNDDISDDLSAGVTSYPGGLTGTSDGQDIVYAFGGDDYVYAFAGDDVLDG